MSIKTNLQTHLNNAMKMKDMAKVKTLRLIHSAIKQIEIDERIELDEARLLTLLDKLAKQRKESIMQFEKANRVDLVEQEKYELNIIQSFLPKPYNSTEIEAIIQQAFDEVKPQGMKDMGRIMSIVKPKLQGRADMADVSKQIKNKF